MWTAKSDERLELYKGESKVIAKLEWEEGNQKWGLLYRPDNQDYMYIRIEGFKKTDTEKVKKVAIEQIAEFCRIKENLWKRRAEDAEAMLCNG